ncbi:MAG: 50S ribosomal protein L11 methyltransferase [Ilumatobacteraceae bacterium]
MTDPAVPAAWTILELEVPAGSAEIVSDALWGLGVAAVEETPMSGGSVVLRANVSPLHDETVVELARRHGGVAKWVTVPVSVADTWRAHARATHVAGDVWLVPEWVEAPEGRTIRVEPFDVFGMGNHPTTVLALSAALDVVRDGHTVLDMGCGSGVLAVALSALTGCACECHDIAPQARDAVEHNAALNGVSDRVKWREGLDPGERAGYDVVVANILAPVLCEIADALVAVTKPGGTVVLSGLREDQTERVAAAYTGCDITDQRLDGGWASLTLCRP